jgi:uncharacterized protein (DUF58 family)
LSGAAEQPLMISAGSGEAHYRAILDQLAVLDASGATPYGAQLERAAAQCLPGETVVIFLSPAPELTEDILRALALLRARHAHLFAVLFDRNSFIGDALPSPVETASNDALLATLLDLGAHCVPVRNGDDLVRVFNS